MLSLIRDKRHYDVEHFVGETSPFFCVFPLQNLHISNIFCTFALAKVLIQKYETVTNCYQLKLTAADAKSGGLTGEEQY